MHVNRDNGLPSDVVYFVMPDREGALWLGLDAGLARLEVPSPVSFFDPADGLAGTAIDVVRMDGRLYLAGQTGVHYLEPAGPGRRQHGFSRCRPSTRSAGRSARCRTAPRAAAADRRVHGRALRDRGEYCEADLRPRRQHVPRGVSLPSKARPDAAVGRHVRRHCLVQADWRSMGTEGLVAGVTEEVRTLFENPDGSLWAGTAKRRRILRLSLTSAAMPGQPRPAITVERFGTAHGIPEGGAGVFDAAGTPLFMVGPEEPYAARFDSGSRRFVREKAFESVGADPLAVGDITGFETGPDGRVYVDFGRETVVAQRRPDGTWDLDRTPFRASGPAHSQLYPEPDGVVWLLRPPQQVVRYALRRATALPAVAFPALIRHVTVNDRHLFGGGATLPAPSLDAASNALRIEFAAPGFVDESATEYQSMLDGLETEWSAWTRESRRDFTNLGFGDYRFRVRARNLSGAISEEATYAFTILPPWYRTWLGVRRLLRSCWRSRLWHRPAAAPPRRRQGARAREVRRGAAAGGSGRGAGEVGERGQEERRAAQRDGPRDHRVARLRHDLRQALRKGQPPRRCRRLRRRPLSPRATARSNTGWRSRRASATRPTRATRRTTTSCRSGASSIASRCSSTTSRPSTDATSHIRRGQPVSSRTARCRSSRSRSSTCR